MDQRVNILSERTEGQAPERKRSGASTSLHEQEVRWVRHWNDSLFSFALTRPSTFRFRSGEFVMIGLEGETRPLMRAYSIASQAYSDELEFFSIKVPNGPLTSRLQAIQPGDRVLLARKPTGTLVLDALKPGRRLFLFATGTGLAPFLSVVRDPDTYMAFDQVILVHTVRQVCDLAYRDLLTTGMADDPLVGEEAEQRLTYYPAVTREPFERPGRITERIASGAFFTDCGMTGQCFDPKEDRAMICGSMAMNRDVAALLEKDGLTEGSNAAPGEFVLERAFVG